MIPLGDFDLDVPFKGTRDYVQSADLYDALMARLGAACRLEDVSDVRLLCRSLARRPLRALVGGPTSECHALLTFHSAVGGGKTRIAVVGREGAPAGRRECPEERIVSQSVLDEETGSITCRMGPSPGFTLCEAAVALNKALHLRTFAGYPGKWLLTEIRTPLPLLSRGSCEVGIRLKSRSTTRLTRSTIVLDGEESGYICFSLTG